MDCKYSTSKGRDQTDDYALIKAFQNGENDAFDALLIRHKDRVFNLCLRFLGDYHEAEDTAQDVFIKAYNSLNRFRFESSFFTWLYRIAINTCKNKVKSLGYRFRKTGTSIDIPEEFTEGPRSEHSEGLARSPALELENREMMRMLQNAINSLPSDQRSVVILRDVQGLSYEEISGITGFKLGTLKSKLSRARSSLKKKIGDII